MRSVGTFRYSPEVNGSLIRRDGGSTEWWLIIDCDPELGRYLRHLHAAAHWKVREARPPLWGTHISVIRGECPPVMAAWNLLADVAVEFTFEPVVRQTDAYLWVPVTCPAALQHREELGLCREPEPAMHMTIGNLLHEDD